LRRYQVDYVLVNELFPQSFRTYNAFVHLESFRNAVRWMQERPLRYAEIETPPGISLFRVVGEGREEERAAPREDLAVGGPALAVPQEGNLILLGGRLGKKHAAPGEGIPMTTLWSLQGSDAGPLPMSLYARAYRPGEPRAERFSLVRSREKAPWRIFTLGGLAYPYILWKEGDRVLDEQLLRVPKETPDGTYIIEVTAHASPFRPVRRLSGMERGAIRTGWTVIDTVEVRS